MRRPGHLLPFLLLGVLLVALLGLPSSARAESSPTPSRQGAWPLAPRPAVDAGFDPPTSRYGAGHRGVDLVGHVGQGVHSTLGGRVTFAARLAGRGVVVVEHGGLRTTYEPVSATVSAGDVVARGGLIGTLQRAQSHCFPRACLHWGLLRGSSYLDPLVLVGAGPVRLLPLEGTPGVGIGGQPTARRGGRWGGPLLAQAGAAGATSTPGGRPAVRATSAAGSMRRPV